MTKVTEAFEQFTKQQTKFSEDEVSLLKEALENYMTYDPSEDFKQYQRENPGTPLQMVRDQTIVDYLHKGKRLELKKAVSLWSDWEDYEYENTLIDF